jgi:alpha-mannosidase
MDDRIIVARLQALQGLCTREARPLGPWQARTARHLAPGQYEFLDDWRDVEGSTRWPAGVTVFFRAQATTPEGWDPEQTFLSFSFGDMEGLLEVNGVHWSGIDWAHTRCPVPSMGALDLSLEFDSVPRARHEAHLAGAESTFGGGALVEVDAPVEAAYYDFRFAFEAARVITDERRRQLVSQAIEDGMVMFDLTAPREQLVADIARAAAFLRERLAGIAPDPEGGRILLAGHTHIDTAWLWPLSETVRKCGRTFSTASWMMERYPEYRFACNQAQLYDYTRRHYPDVYQRLRPLVESGRWETTGGMWVECDCNVTSGESLIRQFLHGLRYFREEYGTRPTLCWLPDVFGYNAGMPQILLGCGIRHFWTWKLHWQSRNPFPYHLFWWQGVDGSRVMAHIPKLGGGAYNGHPQPRELATAWQTYVQKATYDEQLMPFGYGDGGGGVNEEMMEFAARAAAFPGLPACRQGTAGDFFAGVEAAAPELPTWVGELYLETHRGTYTSQGRIKRANRQCELALRGAEMTAAVAAFVGAPVDAAATLRECWEKVLLHQFHDILPGSSIGQVYEDSAADHARVLETAARIRQQALTPIMGRASDTLRYGVLNSLSWVRDGVVELDAPDVGDDLVGLMAGRQVPVQVVARADDRMTVLAAVEGVPCVGGAILELEAARPLPSLITATRHALENQYYRLTLNDSGEITSLLDKRCQREVIAAGQTGNQLQLFQDGPEREAAWNVHATYEKRRYEWDETVLRVVESGPVRATVRVEKRRGETVLTQDISVYDHLPRIDFRTRVDWHERQTMLKAAFPVEVHTDHSTAEVPFGVLERPNHTNTSWEQEKFEVCAQRWVDLSEAGYGVSLLNDGKYGHDLRGNVLRVTLLRGPQWPDPEADMGAHEFTYSLLPHEGGWREGQTVRQAWQLNVPLFSISTHVERPPVSFISVDGPAILETLKLADNGDGAILRLYEPHGGRGRVNVEFSFRVQGVRACNLVEEDEGPVDLEGRGFAFDIKPFQVRTFRLR